MPSEIGLLTTRLSEDTEELEDREGFLLTGWKGISSDPAFNKEQLNDKEVKKKSLP